MTSRTLMLRADVTDFERNPSFASADLASAASILRRGGTVAFATETVYGLGANALDADAVARIFDAKQRPAWDPLIVHIAELDMLPLVASVVSRAAQTLLDHFWPGPLTLLLPRVAHLPDTVTAGRPLVGVRMPAHPVARALIRETALPIAAPSANIFGHVSPTTAAHVAVDLDGRIDAILDSGPAIHGVESTVVDASRDTCLLYRPGAITLEQLHSVWAATEVYRHTAASGRPEGLPSPGVSLRHYAPRARLVLIETQEDAHTAAGSEGEQLSQKMSKAVEFAHGEGYTIGLMLPDNLEIENSQKDALYAWGSWDNPMQLAQRLFAGLRALDEQGVQLILCPVPPAIGLGVAISDRLHKAARRD